MSRQQQVQAQQNAMAKAAAAAQAAESNGAADMSSGTTAPPTEADKQAATLANQAFEKSNFGECVSQMNKLMKTRKTDCKVVHNMAVAAFFSSQQLAVEELKNGLSTACQMARSTDDPLEGIEDVENAVLFYNQAVLFFHLKQYRTALSVLDKGFQYIDAPDEALAQNILLLWTELHLCTGQPEKALDVLSYLEKGVSNGKSGERGEGKEGASSASDNDAIRVKIFMMKARALAMMKHLKSLRREMKSIPTATGATGFSIQLMKAYAEYLKGNAKKGLRFVSPFKDSKESRDYITAEEIHRYASQLSKISCPGQSLVMIYYNNLACLHHHMRKHFMALQHLMAAHKENERLTNLQISIKSVSKEHRDKKPLQWAASSRHYELLYNMGIQFLHCSKPQAAFDCLIQAVQVYHTNPRLWLRLAECCIMHHRETNDDDSKMEKRQKVIQGTVGSGFHRKLIISPGTGQDRLSPTSEPAMPSLTLEFASLCLSNAINLLPPDPLDVEPTKTEDGDSKAVPEPPLVPAPPSSPLRPSETANLRCSILSAGAYVALCLTDYIVALKHCKNLLRQPRLSGAQRYLGNMYMAEALLVSDRIADAISHLNPDSLTPADISTVPPPEPKSEQEKSEKEDRDQDDRQGPDALVQWIPSDVRRARGFMQHNLAVCHATRGEHGKAINILRESGANLGSPFPAQLLYLNIYLDLIQGNTADYHSVIREHFGHMTPNHKA